MSPHFRSEAAARDALAAWLSSGLSAQLAFLSSLPSNLTAELDGQVPFTVEVEHISDVGKRIDILLSSCKHVICIELKIDHRENPFQYAMYRRYLERRGFKVTVIGIMPRRMRNRGREALNTAILDWLADHRMTWAELTGAIHKRPGTGAFVEAIRTIDPALLIDLKEPRPIRASTPEIHFIDTRPEHLAAFFGKFLQELPVDMSAYPDQAGSSPPLLRFGRISWANWFSDADNERIFLEIDIPRKSKFLSETQFHFGVTLWSKTSSGQREPVNIGPILTAARLLESQGFVFQRNIPGKYQPIEWHPSQGLGSTGLYYLNASDHRNFTLVKSEAVQLGVSKTIQRLISASDRISKTLDGITRSS